MSDLRPAERALLTALVDGEWHFVTTIQIRPPRAKRNAIIRALAHGWIVRRQLWAHVLPDYRLTPAGRAAYLLDSGALGMTEAERVRAQEYICEAWYHLQESQVSYALAYLDTMGVPGAPWPDPMTYGFMPETEAARLRDAVEMLLEDLRTPGFDQDDPRTL